MNYQGDEVRRRILKSFHIFDQLLITIIRKMIELLYVGTVENEHLSITCFQALGHGRVGEITRFTHVSVVYPPL